MNKVYLVIRNWSCESSGNVDMQNIYVFKNYADAYKCFKTEKDEIKSFNTGYDEIVDEDNYYCESVNGEYLYYHELVYIKEKEVVDYE